MDIVENLIRKVSSEGVEYNYIYRLTKDTINICYENDNMQVQSYGIEVERQDYVNGQNINIERDSIKSISPHRYKVHNLLKLLYDNTVSPLHFIDVLSEYIDDYILDFDENYKETITI